MIYNNNNLAEVLETHERWLAGDPDGNCAIFSFKNLTNKDLSYRKLTKANLYRTDCSGTNFSGADLSGTYFHHADLSGADFTDAIFTDGTSFEGAVFSPDTKISYPMSCPEEGSFIAYKAVHKGYIVKLLVPDDARRSSATGKKCRCDKAKVISILYPDGRLSSIKNVHSKFDKSFVYCIGETVSVPDFDECRWHECAPGIHFFMDIHDAMRYYTSNL